MTEQWQRLLEGSDSERQKALEFLYAHLPQSDLDSYPAELFARFADHALGVRREKSWCAKLDWELFAHYVLFPRVNDEALAFYSEEFSAALWPRLADLDSDEERLQAVNRWCHEHASYEAQDDRTAAPLTVYRCGSGRCGEESVFLVAALRSVGIAARQVYCPRWAHCDDNHAWVEALCDGQWRFLGACEPEPLLDRGWFNTAASRAILVHSRLFGEGTHPLHGLLLGREGGVSWYNQTARYAPVKKRVFRALVNGMPAPGACFQLQLLNEAAFHTIAVLTADERGEAAAELGLGDFHVLVLYRGLRAEGDCTGEELTLSLTAPDEAEAPEARWRELDIRAPITAPPLLLSPEERAKREKVLTEGTAIRQARLASFARPGDGDLLREARGNRDEIAAFLERDGDPRRAALLRALTRKDLRDAKAEILEDHLQTCPPRGPEPEKVYERWLLSPRIALEPLTAWRSALPVLDAADPAALWAELRARVSADAPRTYKNLVWTPEAAWTAGRCDEASRRLLFVALLRRAGVPARLRPLDGEPEYWRGGAFCPISAEQNGVLELHAAGSPAYRRDWSVSRRTQDGWKRLTLTEPWRDGRLKVRLPAGVYRLITTVRLPNGNQAAALREVQILAEKTTACTLRFREYSLKDALVCHTLPPLPAVTPEGETAAPLFCPTGRPGLLLWLKAGGEPTEHLLNELAALPPEEPKAAVTLLVQEKTALSHSALARLLEKRPEFQPLLDDWRYDMQTLARQMGCDPSAPPLAVVCDQEGRAVYGCSGYRVGAADLLCRIADAFADSGA